MSSCPPAAGTSGNPPGPGGGALQVSQAGKPPRLMITGDIDESSYPGLIAALSDLPEGPGEIHIYLAGVQYCDLAGLRALICLTDRTGRQDRSRRRVILHGPPAYLAAVMQILGWDSTPGLVIEQS